LTLEDLGSSNGTFVNGKRLNSREKVELAPGDTIEMGSTTLLVQRSSAVLRPSSLVDDESFKSQLERILAGGTDTVFTVAHVRVRTEDVTVNWAPSVAGILSSGDVFTETAPGAFDVVLGTASADARASVTNLRADLEARGVKCDVGIANHPRDGHSAKDLIDCARKRASATGSGPSDIPPNAVISKNPRVRALYDLVDRIASSRINVLILGETGVGKEVMAETIVQRSNRANRPFVRLNCGAFTESLLESELFGYERGAFTGATTSKPGLLESADGGTVFLDEVGELPLSIQVKLLRVLEERAVRRVGALRGKAIDVRLIAATNRDLEQDVAAKTFRQDLYFRLNGMALHIPPLRERTEEIEPMARAFLHQAALANDVDPCPKLSEEALAHLRVHDWPGNVRELRNVIERAALVATGVITPSDLALSSAGGSWTQVMRAAAVPSAPETGSLPRIAPASEGGPVSKNALRDEIAETERRRILDALEECGGNQSRAAKMLGISRRTLINRLDDYGVARPRKGQTED
jgi:two-component system response regulator AtoC